MTRLNFIKLMQSRLGGNLIDVELIYEDFDTAFNLATLTYRTKAQDDLNHEFYALSVNPTDVTYAIPAEIDQIIKIIKPRASGFSIDDPFDVAIAQSFFGGLASGASGMVGFELTSQLIEYYERYTAHEVQFIHKRLTDELYIMNPASGNEVWFLDCYRRLTDDEYRDILWIQEWALAECMIILGRAYQKFQTISTPSGDASLNGNELIQEAKEMKEKLLTDIINYNDSEEPTGSPITLG